MNEALEPHQAEKIEVETFSFSILKIDLEFNE